MLTFLRERLRTYNPVLIEAPGDVRAAVMAAIFEKEGSPYIILTKRSNRVRVHKGEVSFPGGMWEDGDGNTVNTALRECCEEIGARKKDIEIIGQLDDMVTMTGYVITPHVGILAYPYDFTINPEEVASLIYLPLGHLMNTEPSMEMAEHLGMRKPVLSIYYEGERIWGATCRILLRFKEILKNETV